MLKEPLLEVIAQSQTIERREKKSPAINSLLKKKSVKTNDDGPSSSVYYGSVLYLITELGTIICLWFDMKRQVVEKVKVSDYVKKLVCFKIRQVQVT